MEDSDVQVRVDVPDNEQQAIAGGVPTSVWRRPHMKIAVVVGIAVVIGVAVGVAITLANRAAAGAVVLPQTFTAQFAMTPTDPNAATVQGSFYKTVAPDGEWVITGYATATSRNQKTVVVAADDGGVYYTVMTTNEQVLYQGCLQSLDSVPALGSLRSAINDVRVVNGQQAGAQIPAECTDTSKVWALSFNGLSLVLCQAKTNVFVVSGTAYSGSVFDVESTPQVLSSYAPLVNATSGDTMKCPSVYKSLPTGSGSSRRLVSFTPIKIVTTTTPTVLPSGCPPTATSTTGSSAASSVSKLVKKARRMAAGSSSGASRCVFVHGAGVLPSATEAVTSSSFPAYWGTVEEHVSCESKVFLHLDTTTRGWDAAALHEAFCQAAADGQADRTNIGSTQVFAHGSGNLIVASALATGKCNFDWTTSSWFELQSDANGDVFGQFAANVCGAFHQDSPEQQLLQKDWNFCVNGQAAAGWTSQQAGYTPTGVTWDAVSHLIKSKVSGGMCGVSAQGLMTSRYFNVAKQDVFDSVASVASWSTCWDEATIGEYSIDSNSMFYLPSVNYLDVTCRNGNGMFGENRQPCAWFEAVSA